MHELKEFLKVSQMFGKINDQDLTALSEAMDVDQYDSGHVFSRQGETCNALHLLLEGTVQIHKKNIITGTDNDPINLHVGDIFSQLALGSGIKNDNTCIALGDVVTARLEKETFAKLIKTNPAIEFSFQFILASQLARELQAINALSRS